jgi:ParB-like chromosome segregation protein Spo0J
MPTVVHKTVMMDPREMVPASYNPRRISRRMKDALKANIRAHGFVEPVVVQAGSKVIIAGHQRVAALTEIAEEAGERPPKIPAVVLEVSDRQARLLNIAMNKIDGEFDDTALAALLASLDAVSPEELLATGLSAREAAALAPAPAAQEDTSAFARSVTLTVRFETVEARDATKALLDERAQRTGKKAAVVLRELLA